MLEAASWPLDGPWTVQLEVEHVPGDQGTKFLKTSWVFRYSGDDVLEVTGERTSGELIGEHTPMLLDDDAEEFAQFLAGKVGWPVAP